MANIADIIAVMALAAKNLIKKPKAHKRKVRKIRGGRSRNLVACPNKISKRMRRQRGYE